MTGRQGTPFALTYDPNMPEDAMASKTPPKPQQPAPPVAGGLAPSATDDAASAASHDEALIDEALRETFPASDPISPSLPADKNKPRAA